MTKLSPSTLSAIGLPPSHELKVGERFLLTGKEITLREIGNGVFEVRRTA